MDMLILFGVTGLLRVLPHVETFNIIFASVNGRGLDFKLVICVTTTIGVRSSFLTRQAFFDYWCEASGLYEPPNSLACPSRVDVCSGRLIWGWISSIRLSVPTYPKFYPVL